MLKRLLLGGLIAMMASGEGAIGAERPLAKPVKPRVAARDYDWTGFYIGSHFGYATGYSRWSATEPGMTDFTLAGSLDLFKAFDGFKGTGSYYLGLHGGYNYMFPSRFLIGIEADASFPSNIHGIQTISSDLTGVATYEEMAQWSSTVRGTRPLALLRNRRGGLDL